jgi:S1-C subfamily serine protease
MNANDHARLRLLEREIQTLKDISKAKSPSKTALDILMQILPPVTTLISSVFLAGIGLYFTTQYNKQAAVTAQITVAEKFADKLTNVKPEIRREALLMVAALGNERLAIGLARLHFDDPQSIQLLAGFSNSTDQSVRQAALEALTPLVEKARSSVVEIRGNGCQFSGVVAREDVIVTIRPACTIDTPLEVHTFDGRVVTVDSGKTQFIPETDLLLVRLEQNLEVPILKFEEPTGGERVFAIGGLNSNLPAVGTSVGPTYNNLWRYRFDLLDTESFPGTPGGPLLNEKGIAKGIVFKSLDTVHKKYGFAIPGSVINKALDGVPHGS